MFKSQYRKEVIDVIKDIVFLQSYDETLEGICLYGYCDPENELELMCFYKDLDKQSHETFSNSYYIGDTYIKCVNLDMKRYNAFKAEIFSGVIVYDPKATLSSLLNKEILEQKSYCVCNNEIGFDTEFTKDLIDSIILNSIKEKNKDEKFNSLVNIYSNLIDCKEDLEEDDYDIFSGITKSCNKLFLSKKDSKLYNKALTEALNNKIKNNSLIKKK